ncbi:zinc finger protein 239-like [Bolinopsis microptera]|uniref:zinc finger protein 239-like n=1 Tax=Bolinopsis microptera TaxID=2820187 RepID=UPI00307A9DD9
MNIEDLLSLKTPTPSFRPPPPSRHTTSSTDSSTSSENGETSTLCFGSSPRKKLCLTSNAGREPNPSFLCSSSIAKMFACSSCGVMFQSRSELYSHFRDIHKHKLFSCSYCSKLFTRSSSLKTHTRVHTGERPYQCTECGKTFTQLSNVLQHNRDVHIKDKRFKCKLCEKGFSRLETLQCHIRVHTGERIYKCEVCQKSFSQRANLKVHTRIHRGERTRPKRARTTPSIPQTHPPKVINPVIVVPSTHHRTVLPTQLCFNGAFIVAGRTFNNNLAFTRESDSGLDFLLPTVALKLLFDVIVSLHFA